MSSGLKRIILAYGGTIVAALLFALLVRHFFFETYRVPTLPPPSGSALSKTSLSALQGGFSNFSSNSMKPTLIPGDLLFVKKWPYSSRHLGQIWLKKWGHTQLGPQILHTFLPDPDSMIPNRGDVILFSQLSYPQGSRLDFIKRVVGLPGDEVMMRQGRLFLNGRRLPVSPTENRNLGQNVVCQIETLPEGIAHDVCSYSTPNLVMENFGPEKVPLDSIFVIGDFRSSEHSTGALSSKKAALKRLSAKTNRMGWGTVPLSSVLGKAVWIWMSIDPASSTQASNQISLNEETPSNPRLRPSLRWNRMLRRIL